MRFAVIADIHGNLAALQAILDRLDQGNQPIERLVSAGDAIGFGPYPNEVLDLLRTREAGLVLGNYEDSVAHERRLNSGVDFADVEAEKADQRAVRWTRRSLREDNLAFVRELPREQRMFDLGSRVRKRSTDEELAQPSGKRILGGMFIGNIFRPKLMAGTRIRVVHGSPRALNEFVRPDTPNSTMEILAREAQVDVLVSGHAGVGFQRTLNGVTFIGVGSASGRMAKPGEAEFAVVDVSADVDVDFLKAHYDAEAYLASVEERGLPAPSWERPRLVQA